MVFKEIITQNLSINSIAITDAAFIFELVNTEGWLKNIGERNVKSIEAAEDYIQKIGIRENFNYLVIRQISTAEPIGIISVILREGYKHFDIGFALLPKFINKGFAFEASNAVLASLENSQSHKKILGICLETNLPSIRLLKKLGMKLEKKFVENDEKKNLFSKIL